MEAIIQYHIWEYEKEHESLNWEPKKLSHKKRSENTIYKQEKKWKYYFRVWAKTLFKYVDKLNARVQLTSSESNTEC